MPLVRTDGSQEWRRKAFAVEPGLLMRDELFGELLLPEFGAYVPVIAPSLEQVLLRERRTSRFNHDAVFSDPIE